MHFHICALAVILCILLLGYQVYRESISVKLVDPSGKLHLLKAPLTAAPPSSGFLLENYLFACAAITFSYQIKRQQTLPIDAFADPRFTDAAILDLNYLKGPNPFGYMCLVKDPYPQVLLIFRGTQGLREWQTDFTVGISPYTFGKGTSRETRLNMHSGFGEAYFRNGGLRQSIENYLSSVPLSTPIFIAGHSMGAALAQVAALDLSLTGRSISSVYSIAPPRWLVPVSVKLYNDELANVTYRVSNEADMINSLPPPYTPVARCFAHCAFSPSTTFQYLDLGGEGGCADAPFHLHGLPVYVKAGAKRLFGKDESIKELFQGIGQDIFTEIP